MIDKARSNSVEDEEVATGRVDTGATADQDADANFFKVISENLKYAFNSPLPTTQFPTPYSSNQLQTSQNQNQLHPQQQQQPSESENSSSLMENSMLPGFPIGINTATGEPLNDMNMQPSSVLQFGNTFPNEFLLASPEQFREFLFESPAGFNFLHKTPAKTPLRFVSGSMENENDDGGANLFGSGTLKSNNGNINNPGGSKFTQTPLRNIDLNLLFNSNQMAVSSSPSKKVAISLTPYGRKVLNDIGTPYAKSLLSSNSALADFQKARKDVNRVQSSPPKIKKIVRTPQTKSHNKSRHMLSLNCSNQDQEIPKNDLRSCDSHLDVEDADIYGSSPTTIQLNSSVTKSTSKLNANRIPSFTRELTDCNIDEQLFKVEDGRLQISPTPKCHHSSSLDALKIPELPKMGSFKSERTLSIASNLSTKSNSSGSASSRSGKVKKSSKKQPKFQIIVANAQKFNVPTVNQKSSKKMGGLKRSQSLLVGSSSAKGNGKNNGKNNSNVINSKGSNGNKGKRSNSFTDKRQFYGFQ